MERIINMIIRQVLNRLIRTGVNRGFDAFGKRKGGGDEDGHEDPAMKSQGKDATKRLRQSMRVTRKIRKM